MDVDAVKIIVLIEKWRTIFDFGLKRLLHVEEKLTGNRQK